MTICPHCGATEQQAKAGMNGDTQRYKCGVCRRRYSPASGSRGYPDEVRRRAAALHAQGMPVRQVARQLGVNHQSVANWLRRREGGDAATAPMSPEESSPEPAKPEPVKQRPTIGDVARQAGVSTATVSNYLNQKGRMSGATRLRIREAVEALHFTPSALVRAIRDRRTHILGVLIFGLDRLDQEGEPGLTPALLGGIHDGADAAGNDLLFHTGWPRRAHSGPGLRLLDGHTDGLLWVIPRADDPDLARVVAAGLPVVALLTRHVPAGVGYVNADNLGAMEAVVAHLTERGHRRIAYVGSDRMSNFRDRREGFRRALEARGLWDAALQPDDEKCRPREGGGRRVLDELLALPSPPTAVVCGTDNQAAWLAEAIQARGMRIPDDLALTGFDDNSIARHVAGGLTTLRQPLREMGRLAAESLLALIEGEPADAHRRTVPTELVVRASTGGPEKTDWPTPLVPRGNREFRPGERL